MQNNQEFIDELNKECTYLLEVKYLCEVQSLENVTRMNLESQEREDSIKCHLTLVQLVDNLILLNLNLICMLQTTLTVDEDAYRSYLNSLDLVKANTNECTITNRTHYIEWLNSLSVPTLDEEGCFAM
ncbi:MAG: hypothetical protein J0647_07395 [Campylobacteraceae bacterium]|nr:hypothetical protein [Campylobacteraceae bacterium]